MVSLMIVFIIAVLAAGGVIVKCIDRNAWYSSK